MPWWTEKPGSDMGSIPRAADKNWSALPSLYSTGFLAWFDKLQAQSQALRGGSNTQY